VRDGNFCRKGIGELCKCMGTRKAILSPSWAFMVFMEFSVEWKAPSLEWDSVLHSGPLFGRWVLLCFVLPSVINFSLCDFWLLSLFAYALCCNYVLNIVFCCFCIVCLFRAINLCRVTWAACSCAMEQLCNTYVCLFLFF
jgi:hypothetical protein